MQLHEKIRKWRKEQEFSQTYMGVKMNIRQQAYSKIECGLTKLTDDIKASLSKILKQPVSEFNDNSNSDEANSLPPAKEIEYLKDIRRLQEMLIELMKNKGK